MEDMLKAGHCVEFERETQFCAKAIGNADGKNMRNDVDFMDPNWFKMRRPSESSPSAMNDEAGLFSPSSQRIMTWSSIVGLQRSFSFAGKRLQ
jgi:hypothetical protein